MSQRPPQNQSRNWVQSGPAVTYAEVHQEDTDSERESISDVSGQGYECKIGVGQSESEEEVGQDAAQLRDRSPSGEVSDQYAQELEARCRVMEQLLQQNLAPRPVADQSNQSRLDCVPEYDPVSSKMMLRTWIHKLEQLQAVYNWTESALIYHMQAKLKGTARKWYDSLLEYALSLEEWKVKLMTTFPDH